MPKKWIGENNKSADARARKAEVKNIEREKKQKESEDAAWRDDDKNAQKKNKRNEEKQQKHEEKVKKQQELRELAEKEEQELSKISKKGKDSTPKLTRLQIQEALEKERIKKEQEQKKQQEIEGNGLVPEVNPNIATAEFFATHDVVTEGIDEALAATSMTDADRNPEKRRKAKFMAFEERRMAELKDEFPSLRRSQLKEMVWKEWQKSPENPDVQAQLQAQADTLVAKKSSRSVLTDSD